VVTNRKIFKRLFFINNMDYEQFFSRKAEVVARDLLGRALVRKTDKGITTGRILETAAYEYGSETPSRTGMKYSPGKIFLMPYRSFRMLNIATDKEGKPSCVEIRTLGLHNKIIRGSARIANHLGIGKNLDGILLGDELEITGESVKRTEIKVYKGGSDNCIGIYSLE